MESRTGAMCLTKGSIDVCLLTTHSNNIAVSIMHGLYIVQSNYELHTVHGGVFGLSLYCISIRN
jgi:hypothetical protein